MAINPDTRSAVQEHPIFGKLPEATLEQLLEKAEEMNIDAGEKLIIQGEFNPWLFLLLHGKARVLVDDEEVGVLEPGQLAGEISTSGLSSPIADVEAVENLSVIAFPVEEINNVAFEMEVFAEALRTLGMKHASDTYGEWED